MGYLVGVDGGGTSTRVLIVHSDSPDMPIVRKFDVSLKIRNKAYAACASGLGKLLESIGDGIIGDIDGLVLGLSGALREELQTWINAEIARWFRMPRERVRVMSDLELVLEAAVQDGGQGAVLIAGTGSSFICRSAKGIRRICGGWGPLIGDEGSGTWIGLEAAKHLTRRFDGREHAYKFYIELLGALPGNVSNDLRSLPAALLSEPALASQLCEAVLNSQCNEPFSSLIIDRAVESLVSLVEGGLRQIEWTEGKIAIHGGIGLHPVIYPRLKEALSKHSGLGVTQLAEDTVLKRALEMARELIRQ